jgi:SAM-dependent methyltransferase
MIEKTIARPTRGHGLLEPALARLRARRARRLLPEGLASGALLDIGCGSFPFFLLSTPAATRYGLDQLDSGLPDEFDGGIELVRHDLNLDPRLPFPSDSFDAVTMLAVFEHLPPRVLRSVLKEVRRVLRPGGVYVMTTPARWTPKVLDLLVRVKMLSQHEIDEHKGAYGHDEIRALLREAGFADAEIRLGYFEAFMNNWATVTKA